jgi:nucleoside-diphosphate-sugar epimerase
VFHLAARTGVPDAWQRPAEFHRVNAHGTVRLLEQCRGKKVRFLYVSGYVYGRPERMPITEDARVDANNPYAFSKYAAEQACRFYADHTGLVVTIVRPFNVYGGGQDNRFLLSRIIEQALDPAAPRIELMDLSPRRDYVHVDDLVDAILGLSDGDHTGTFNVGSGESFSVGEAAALVQKHAGSDKPVVAVGSPRQNEIADVRADISRIRAAIGWEPRISFEQGLSRMVEEMRAR